MTFTHEFVAEVAGKLSPLMREAMEHSPWTHRIGFNCVTTKTARALNRRGLIDESYAFTPLGLAVRDHLNGEKG